MSNNLISTNKQMDTSNINTSEDKSNITLKLKEEQLDVVKEWITIGEVNIYRHTFSEEKNFTIPINREELIIEKKNLGSPNPKNNYTQEEIIRIPLSEEQIEFSKHKVNLEDISLYIDTLQNTQHIEETLKKEQLKIKVLGSPKISDN
ncbi:YsnF/AvaK domain-containing protein [Clostridium cellulovorans]|uniref:DUF2382 domain-containing protein n=1 Tax=Clostridium cellulovorans (strain ATCC 35296 / DSM 3052 / OCM 3 / 743B) TaxID=573061 RepID=D9SNF5_CLOC7|nr:YsnF/AvaK domain-containing protein [Clostridium cellulovorans]ADL53947.1 Domain of unknown function DUF2382-like [Clostridium cellulovorans 743B]